MLDGGLRQSSCYFTKPEEVIYTKGWNHMAVKTYDKTSSDKLSANFKVSEFKCKGSGCCNTILVDEELVTTLQKIRDHFGAAVTINSGYRCPVHNKNVGGASGSQHVKGKAADIVVRGVKPAEVAKYAESIGVRGIGLYETDSDGHFVHVDTRTNKSFWYGQKNEYRSTFGGAVKPVTGTPSTGSEADEKVIWDYLFNKLGNKYGVAGLMGNLYAESALRSHNLQGTYERKLGFTDVSYTEAVDSGEYDNFVKDRAGYGLAQWTYWTRKQRLYDYARKAGKSIGDRDMQLAFLCEEMSTNYTGVWNALKNAKSVREASDLVLTKFEMPADMSESVQLKRSSYGQKYYNKYATPKKEPEKPSTTKTTYAEKRDKSLSGTYKVTAAGGLNLRAGAGTNHKSVGVLKPGSKVYNYGYYSTASNGRKWLYVQVADGTEGFKNGTVGFCSITYLKKI